MGGLKERAGTWLVQQEHNACDGYGGADWAEGPGAAVGSGNHLVFLLEVKDRWITLTAGINHCAGKYSETSKP